MSSENTEQKYRGFTQDFLVDGLGGLIPGILFLIGVIVVLAPASQAVSSAMAESLDEASLMNSVRSLLQASSNTPSMIWIGAFVCALMLSYFLGLLFYRLDPKTPDRKSFAGLAKGGLADQSMHDREKWLRQNYGCDNERDCEFPYPYLREYLEHRGHYHLLDLVPWSDNTSKRSKTHLNRLKIRLKYYCPEKCWPIVRNEAQVRLATSMWYVAVVLMYTSAVGLIVSAAALGLAWAHASSDPALIQSPWAVARWVFPFVLSPGVVFCVSWFCKSRVERFVHYQRLHEVFYVLELAYTAAKEHPEITHNGDPQASPPALSQPVLVTGATPPSPQPAAL
jgi:hypothetical protein